MDIFTAQHGPGIKANLPSFDVQANEKLVVGDMWERIEYISDSSSGYAIFQEISVIQGTYQGSGLRRYRRTKFVAFSTGWSMSAQNPRRLAKLRSALAL